MVRATRHHPENPKRVSICGEESTLSSRQIRPTSESEKAARRFARIGRDFSFGKGAQQSGLFQSSEVSFPVVVSHILQYKKKY